jgi:adenylosuccinate synthase
VGGAITGLGIGPKHIERVIGISKGYSTRVGAGPFPTELTDERGDHLRGTGTHPWDEFGTTTGRPRRCGWLDTVVVRYAARINGVTELVLTKLDVLSGFTEIAICDAYQRDSAAVRELPPDEIGLEGCEPVYEMMAGWPGDIMDVRQFEDLPAAACDYARRIEEITNVPVKLITVGPEREQTIIRE